MKDRRGEENGNAKLSVEQIREIKRQHADLLKRLATEYGITRTHLHKVISGGRWAHLHPEEAP